MDRVLQALPADPTASTGGALHRDMLSDAGAQAELLALLGHELRTPLTAILLWASSVHEREATPAELSRALDAIVESAGLQSRLLEDLLDLSRLASGRLSLQRASVDLAQLAQATRELVGPLARGRQVSVELEGDAELGSAELDAGRVQQALLGLLADVIKGTATQGRVKLRVDRVGTDVCIEVSGELPTRPQDRHCSAAPLAEKRARPEGAGSGLSLALSRRLIELHGGSLELVALAGQGTHYRVRLPVGAADGVESSSPAPPAVPRRLQGVSVLIIEDDTNTRQAMQWILEAAHAKVLAAADGAEALQALGLDHSAAAVADRASTLPNIDVVVCDLDLPDAEGCELVQRIARAYAHAERPVPATCALTAHTRLADRQRVLSAGFDLHLAKPLTAQRLTEAIDDLYDVARRATNRHCPPFNQE